MLSRLRFRVAHMVELEFDWFIFGNDCMRLQILECLTNLEENHFFKIMKLRSCFRKQKLEQHTLINSIISFIGACFS